MSRPALKNVSTAALQAEIERRLSKLADLLKVRDDVDRQIADLKVLAGQFGQPVAAPAPAAEEPKPVVKRRRRRKAKAAKVVAKPVAKAEKPGQSDQTAPEFVLGLFAGSKVLTTKELARAWGSASRKGKVGKVLSVLVKAKKLKRRKIKGGQGSTYNLAGAAAKPVVKMPAAVKPVAKPTATKPGQYAQTAGEFVLGLLKGKTLTTQQLAEAWKRAGRGGTVDGQLSLLTKAGKLNRQTLGHKKGSDYSVA